MEGRKVSARGLDVRPRYPPLITLGTDPGLSGAVALLGPGVFEVRRDFKHWGDITKAITELGPRADVAAIELVHSMPGQGVASMFSFGVAAGVSLGSLRSVEFSLFFPFDGTKPLIEVTPQRWQQYYWDLMSVPKDQRRDFDSKKVAAMFYPAAIPFLERGKDHNSADAILIALWKQLNPGAETSKRAKDEKLAKSLVRKAQKNRSI